MLEATGGCKFHLNQTVPGGTCSVEFSLEATWDQVRVANSIRLSYSSIGSPRCDSTYDSVHDAGVILFCNLNWRK